jgi:hypothetical protein
MIVIAKGKLTTDAKKQSSRAGESVIHEAHWDRLTGQKMAAEKLSKANAEKTIMAALKATDARGQAKAVSK